MRTRAGVASLMGIVAGVALTGTLLSQSVRVRVVAGPAALPVPGALLSLEPEPGRPVARALTDESGRATLRAPAPGRYRIRADRIGYTGTVTDPFTLSGDAAASVVVTMPDTRVQLPEIMVRSTQPVCRLARESGTALATVWGEARKALTGTQLTRTAQPPELDVTIFERELDRRDRVTAERSRTDRQRVSRPFVAADYGRLIERGFVEERDGDTWFSAPDADLLLSDAFLESHCFRVAHGQGADTGLVGLAFEPARGRQMPEVEGTLWLDRGSAELRFLEFSYVNLDRRFSNGREGGRLEFQRLPSGGWIVRHWLIRTPSIGLVRGRGLDGGLMERDSLLGWREAGGRAELVAARAGAPPGRAVLTGTVYDSTAGAPLVGAVISIGGGSYADTTDAGGRFRIEAPNEGNFLVSAEHRAITLLGLAPLTGAARLDRGSVTSLELALPPLDRLAPALCASVTVDSGGAAIVTGFLRDSAGIPAPDAAVEIRWRGGASRPGRATITSDGNGIYRLCGLPPRAKLWLRESGGLVPVPGTIAVADHSVTLADVTLVPTHRAATPASLTVSVRDSATGTALEDAVLFLEPSGDSTRTDTQGMGRFPRVRAGAHLLSIRVLGYDGIEREVEVAAGDTLLPIALSPGAVTLAAIEVRSRPGEAVRPLTNGFEERRREANGHFVALAELTGQQGLPLSSLIRQALGVRLVPRPSPCTGYAAASGRRGSANAHSCQAAYFPPACYMAVYLNGAVYWQDGTAMAPPDIDQFRVADLESIEVYVGEAQVPARFQMTGAACGAILLWSRTTSP